MNTKEAISVELEARYHRARSAWTRGVLLYAYELLGNIQENGGKITKAALLNGAEDWQQYSEGGCSFIYDYDICHRLCAPWEIRRKRGGDLPPNSRETWLDVQARALYQAAHIILKFTGDEEE